MVKFDQSPFHSSNQTNQDKFDPSDSEFVFDLQWLQETFLRHWKKTCLLFCVIGLGVFSFFLFEAPRYKSQVKLKVEVKRPVFNLERFLNFQNSSQEFYLAQPNLLQSRRLARNVIDRLSLWNEEEFRTLIGQNQINEVEQAKQASLKVSGSTTPLSIEANTAYSRLVNRYIQHLSVSMERTAPQILYLRFTSKDPTLAAEIANTHAEEYIEFSRKSNALFTDEYIDGLNLQLHQLDNSIMTIDAEILNFKKKNGFFQIQGVSSYDPIQDIDDRLSRVRKQLGEANNELSLAKTSYEACFLPGEADNFAAINSDALQSSNLDKYRSDLTVLQKEFAGLQERYGERHPKYVEASSKIEALLTAIDQEILALVEKKRVEYFKANSRKGSLLEEEQQLISEKYSRDAQWSQLQDLIRTRTQIIDQKSSVVEDLQKAKGSLETQKEIPSRVFEIVDYAEIPLSPENRNWARMILLSIASAIGLTIALVIFIEFQDRTIRTPQQVELITGVSVLGAIPLFQNDDMDVMDGRINPEALSPAAESFIALRTRFLFSDMIQRARTLLVTSSLPNEGKSTVAVNLATSVALLGKKVALVDCDLRKPSLHRFFGEQSSVGMVDIINGVENLEQVLFETDIPGLFLLPAGKTQAMPSEVLTSEAFTELLHSLRDMFDYVFIDSAPILATPDPTILSPQVDSTLLVVRSGKIVKDDLVSALDHINRSGGNVFSTILNGVPQTERSVYTRYGYGYAYGPKPNADASPL